MPDLEEEVVNKQPEYRPKVFCIGLNKTGTTSLGDALSILGYRRYGWGGQAAQFTLRWHEGRFTPQMHAEVEKYDCFEDLPWPLMFEHLDKTYPGSKFILSRRADGETWLKSIQTHVSGGRNWVGHFLVYGSYDPERDAKLYLKTYYSHIMMVREYFANQPGKLLEICFEEGHGWKELCSFLDVDMPGELFPHANRGGQEDLVDASRL